MTRTLVIGPNKGSCSYWVEEEGTYDIKPKRNQTNSKMRPIPEHVFKVKHALVKKLSNSTFTIKSKFLEIYNYRRNKKRPTKWKGI